MSDMDRLKRREAVEGDGGIGRRVSTGALDEHLVADLEAYRQQIRLLLVENVRRVAARAGHNAGGERLAVPRGADRVTNRLVHGLGEAAKLANIEIDPAHVIALALPGNEHHLGLDRAGIARP